MSKLTIKQAQASVKQYDCVLRKTEGGDYRLADSFAAMATEFPNESRTQVLERIELRAYYTDDLQDAINTARFYRPSVTNNAG